PLSTRAAFGREPITPHETGRDGGGACTRKNNCHAKGILLAVLDIGLGAVAAGGGLDVPFAVGGLVFDRLGPPRHALLGGGALGGRKRRGAGRKGFRKHAGD